MNKLFCPNCYSEFDLAPDYCTCGYPLKGSEREEYEFMSAIGKKNKIIQEGVDSAISSRNILFLMGGLGLMLALIFSFMPEADITLILLSVAYSLVMIGLGFYSYREPFFAPLIGFFVLLLAIIISFIIDQDFMLKGIAVRIGIIIAFIFGLVKIKRSENLKKVSNN